MSLLTILILTLYHPALVIICSYVDLYNYSHIMYRPIHTVVHKILTIHIMVQIFITPSGLHIKEILST